MLVKRRFLRDVLIHRVEAPVAIWPGIGTVTHLWQALILGQIELELVQQGHGDELTEDQRNTEQR